MKRLEDWLDPNLEDSAIEIGVVGDFDRDQIISEVARTFGALPKRLKKHQRSDEKIRKLVFPKGTPRPVKLSHAGQSDTAMLRIYWPAPDGRDALTARRMGYAIAIIPASTNRSYEGRRGGKLLPISF